MSLSKLQFKLGNVSNFKVSNISVSNKTKLSDFKSTDILKLTSDLISGKFSVTFVVNVIAKNPNKNSNASLTNITLDDFPWTLYIDGKKTISGKLSNPVNVPAVKSSTVIPLEMSLNLLDFFKGKGLNNLIKLALSLGGKNGSSSNLKLVAKPILGTPIGKLSYPKPITILDKSFTNGR
ncbi:MAG: hypothetical protein CR986_08160 [Ignavibacteriae bacterium]|nr:MAG: hypothetical protein CR986_08160 [Ignavibacteriota bacterium]